MADDRLDGWKEIATYLGKDLRTVQRWERKAGLPICRPNGTGVFAYRSELDSWLKDASGKENERPTQPPAGKRLFSLPRWAKLMMALGLPAFAIATAGISYMRRGSEPANVTVEAGDKLVVSDASGRVLWSRKIDGLKEFVYESYKAVSKMEDLDGDGSKELLLHGQPNPYGNERSRLFCFDSRGNPKWEYTPGKKVTWRGEEFLDRFSVADFSAHAFDNSGNKRVIVVANHKPYYPSQISILDANGNLVGDYWNTGYVFAHDFMDVNGDGSDEIVLGGINNHHRRAFLAAISPTIRGGISPVPEGFAPGFKTGLETAYILFPSTDVGETVGADNRVHYLKAEPAHRLLNVWLEIRATAQESEERVYDLDDRLQPIKLTFPQPLLAWRRALQYEKRLPAGEITEAEKQRLMQFEYLIKP